jgi:hypothetical protein
MTTKKKSAKAKKKAAASASGPARKIDLGGGSGVVVNCAFTDLVPIDEVKPNPKNPNQHPRKQIQLYGKAVKQFGVRRPVTVSNRSGKVVRGHGLLLALQDCGCELVPVDYQDYESAAEESADLAADNRLPEFSDTDDEALAELLLEFEAEAENLLDAAGYTKKDLKDLAAKLDDDLDGGSGGGDDEDAERFEIIVEVAGADEQQQVYEQLTQQGLRCRVLTL